MMLSKFLAFSFKEVDLDYKKKSNFMCMSLLVLGFLGLLEKGLWGCSFAAGTLRNICTRINCCTQVEHAFLICDAQWLSTRREIHKILVWNEISQEEDIFQPFPMAGHTLLRVDGYQLLGKFQVWCIWLSQAFLLNLCLWPLESIWPCGLELLGAVGGIGSQWAPARVSVQPGSDSWCPALWPLLIAWWNYS